MARRAMVIRGGPMGATRAQIFSKLNAQLPSYDLLADMEEPNNDIDTETLQAQIDLAMAQAQNLIASWLPESSSGSLTQSSSRTADAEAELQALLRRPPRYVSSRSFSVILCMYPRTFFFCSPFPGWESVRLSQRLMPLRRRVSCRSYKEVKNAKTARRVRRRKRMGMGTKRAARKSRALAQPESAR